MSPSPCDILFGLESNHRVKAEILSSESLRNKSHGLGVALSPPRPHKPQDPVFEFWKRLSHLSEEGSQGDRDPQTHGESDTRKKLLLELRTREE